MSGCALPAPCGQGPSTACQAALGDHHALLEQGRRLEATDPAKAAALYARAAQSASGTTFIYVPGIRGRAGYVMPVRTGTDQPALPEAAWRLGLLYRDGRGVKQDPDRARRLIEQAAKGGWPEAAALPRSP